MVTYPNQIVVTVNNKVRQGHTFGMIDNDAMTKAAVDLAGQPNAFKLWIYFARNADGYTFAYSTKDVIENFGIKKDALIDAKKVLIEKGYLSLDQGNYYEFDIYPYSENPTDVVGNPD